MAKKHILETPHGLKGRAQEIWVERIDALHCSTDRVFAALMLLQWLGGILLTLLVSPWTWIATTPTMHLHVWAALIFGGALSGFPIFLALRHPGKPLTRHVIALAQMLWSALLIHLTGGRIETHFHVFGSLAFLAFYRDWRVLVTATIVVAVDHWLRGTFWPQSVFGIIVSSPFRWIEHAAWVLFEDVFLVLACLRGQREMELIAERQAELEREVAVRSNAETKLSVLNDELSDRNDEMQQFIYTVSHDLKSPIVTCMGFLGLLREDIQLARYEEMGDSVSRVERAMGRMHKAINDLLELSRIGRVSYTPVPIEMNTLLGELGAELRPRLNERDIRLRVDPGLPSIVADRTRVFEVFENLLTNAFKYGCPQPGMEISVGGSNGNGEARFFVRDHGPGIPRQYHRRVFELFQRLDTTKEGTGIGLTIVEKIMQVHGGRIWIESNPGEGTCFWLAFPNGKHDGQPKALSP